MRVHCPNGHPLFGVQQDAGKGRVRKNKKMQCDGCKDIASVSAFVGCSKCNYDLCKKCAKDAAAAQVSSVNVHELLGTVFHNKDGSAADFEMVNHKTVGVYFWSHKCDICADFSKALAGVYAELKKYSFEIVAVTDIADDADEEGREMESAFSSCPWLTLPFDDEEGRHRLHDWAEEVLGDSPSGCGPTLMLLGPNGELLNKRAMLYFGGGVSYVLNTKWRCPTVGNLSVGPFGGDSDIAMSKVLVVLAENCSKAVVRNLEATLEEAAKLKDGPIVMLGSSAGVAEGIEKDIYLALGNGCTTWKRGWTARAIRSWATEPRVKKADTRPLMMLIDVSEFTDDDNRGYYVSDATLVTIEKITQFLEKVEAGGVPLSRFNYDAYTETFERAAEEEKPLVQPLTGSVSNGCYVGGSWDAFGMDGITGDIPVGPVEDASTASSCSSEYVEEGNNYLAQYKADGGEEQEGKEAKKAKPTPEDYFNRVEELEEVVRCQQKTIDMLLRRMEALETSKKTVTWEGQSRTGTASQCFNQGDKAMAAWKSEDEDSVADCRTATEKKQTSKPEQATGTPWKSEDDCTTDSEDSEVAAYRAKKARSSSVEAKQPKNATKTPWKSEDDDTTDSEDSEVAAYRAKKAQKSSSSATKPEAKTPWKSEDDSATDSEDSEVVAYRAQQAAKKKASNPGKKGKGEPEKAVDKTECKVEEDKPEPSEGAKQEDWTCGQCFQFNWAGTSACAHCSH
eukprot:TRINITY_DN1294_c0_g1_i1.p1 TRINITY_DN1294_c0_g1~~TRINITY_DN1294_c0_g1_i1.p1  ORF type:complete len:735 (+),score=124.21 TRINITY_DN1294_c0_g1_i1:35-2239(+)